MACASSRTSLLFSFGISLLYLKVSVPVWAMRNANMPSFFGHRLGNILGPFDENQVLVVRQNFFPAKRHEFPRVLEPVRVQMKKKFYITFFYGACPVSNLFWYGVSFNYDEGRAVHDLFYGQVFGDGF